jgi:tRNA threonylcarbamoyladenosine biosynthesis protein TsaE
MRKEWHISVQSDYLEIMPDILQFCGHINKWQLFGEMGAGKTTFVHYLGEFLGIEDVSSPTFALVNSYEFPRQTKVFPTLQLHHMDLYRLDTEEELLDLGWEEYLDDPHGLIVEWPQLAQPHWPPPFAELHLLRSNESQERQLIIILQSE